MGTSGRSNASYAEHNSSKGEQEHDRASEQLKNSTTVYKGTTLPHIVVKRQIALSDACKYRLSDASHQRTRSSTNNGATSRV
jgi:hypothetical protein